MKNLIILFWITLSVNCFSQDAKILRTDHKYIVTMLGVEDTCTCKLPYTTYVAILNQEGTNDPVATIYENTTGLTIAWHYDSDGNFYADGFTGGEKVFAIGGDAPNNMTVMRFAWSDPALYIEKADLSLSYDPIPSNGIYNFPIEIRIYE
jgi:hypothetical protein